MGTAPTALGPTADRLHLIDALRALALFGVIAMNFTGMVAAFVASQMFPAATSLDRAFATADLMLLQGKARSAFALLFGIGFGMLMMRAAAKGQAFTAFYLRRMAALLVIGLFNLFFLFWGDILTLYALLGMAMLLFRNWSDGAILRLGLVLLIVPPLLVGLAELVAGGPLPPLAGADAPNAMAALLPVYRSGSYGAFMLANLHIYTDHYLTDSWYVLIYDLGVFGLFLLGLWVARNGVLAHADQWRPFLRKVAIVCLPLGLAFSVVHALRRMNMEPQGWEGIVTMAYAGLPIMAFGYVALLSLWFSRSGAWAQRALAPMGRLALTGYLASNLIGAFTWYGWGLALIDAWNFAAINLFALLVFLSLCVFSAAWLRFFRFGPAEWIWRCATYGRIQPILKRAAAAPLAAG